MNNDYRTVVIESLKKIQLNKSYTNIVINNDVCLLDKGLHNVYRKSVLGVVENLYFLDYVINKFSSIKPKKMEIDVLIALRLAVYQIYFLDNSRENVIVNESVEYVKNNVNYKASQFVNAVLRNILRNKEQLLIDINKLNKTDYLSIKYSYPVWLINLWTKQFGIEIIEDVLIKNNEPAKLNIRVNTDKITRDELKQLLNNKNILCEKCSIADKGLIISNVFEIEKLEEYRKGLFSVQSESSMLVAQILNPEKDSTIIDLCAAPGGKSMDVAERLNNTGRVISRDLYEHKIKLIKNDVKRLDLSNITVNLFDASKLDEKLIEKADYCIVDVPCSGLGIIRRKPEIKYNRNENDSEGLFDLQYNILSNASKYLKIGGELVYSTCTTSPVENIHVIRKFLKHNKDFKMIDITKETKSKFDSSKDGYIEIYPHIHDMDGFFVAKLKKIMI